MKHIYITCFTHVITLMDSIQHEVPQILVAFRLKSDIAIIEL